MTMTNGCILRIRFTILICELCALAMSMHARLNAILKLVSVRISETARVANRIAQNHRN